jgi:hypothetical protein
MLRANSFAGVTIRTAGRLFPALPALCAAARIAPAQAREDCATRINDTPAKAVECIWRDLLWRYFEAFQKIANENPGHFRRFEIRMLFPGQPRASASRTIGVVNQMYLPALSPE